MAAEAAIVIAGARAPFCAYIADSPSSVSRMSLPRRYLLKRLKKPLHTTDGGILATIGDACRYMTALPKHREQRQAWQHTCRLILDRAPAAEITQQLKLALIMDGKLDLGRTA